MRLAPLRLSCALLCKRLTESQGAGCGDYSHVNSGSSEVVHLLLILGHEALRLFQ